LRNEVEEMMTREKVGEGKKKRWAGRQEEPEEEAASR
jgi:hypothetical protein